MAEVSQRCDRPRQVVDEQPQLPRRPWNCSPQYRRQRSASPVIRGRSRFEAHSIAASRLASLKSPLGSVMTKVTFFPTVIALVTSIWTSPR